jgi:LDH2 family malate/lactate/ureidoglycolate dehydrogenase
VTQSRFPIEQLENFAAAALRSAGVNPEQAETTARRLVEADARGRTGHGLIRLGPYIERISAGGINLDPAIEVLHETPTSALVDGDNGLGQVVMSQATELAITKAKATGLAWVGTVHSNHAGAAGVYPLMAAKQGLIAMYFAVANANGMPPWGGTETLLGTNPIAIAIPAKDSGPFLLDIATTQTSHGSIKVAALNNEEMPVGWVIDSDGQPITDPKRAHEGTLVPIGGYKGSGLNIAIGLLAGAMNGAAFLESVIDHRVELSTPTNTGQAIFVMRADLFQPEDAALATMTAHLDQLRSSATADGKPVRLPGDTAAAMEHDSATLGVAVADALVGDLNKLAARLGVANLEQ